MSVYEQVVEAYIAGLEDLNRSGGDLTKIGSVASIFVSRIDVALDKRLDKLGDEKLADGLRGKAGIANAKIAYARYKALFSGPRWQHLAQAGAQTQRLLWASISTKSPPYEDTMYVEALIGRDTVDTIPPATIDAFRDHGEVIPDVIEQDLAGARAILAELEKHGISLKEVTDELVKDGMQQFADAFDKLFGTIAKRRCTLLKDERPYLEIAPGSLGLGKTFGRQAGWPRFHMLDSTDPTQIRTIERAVDLGAAALVKDPQLKEFSGYVQDPGEGRWTVEAAIEEAVPADVLSTALYARFRSRQEHNFGEKMLSAMRFGFGGHIEGNGSIDPEPKPKEPQRHSAAQNAAE